MINFKKFLTKNKLIFKSQSEAFHCAMKIRKRIPEVEEYLLNSTDFSYCLAYAKHVIKGRWKEYEKLLLESQSSIHCYLYAANIIKSQWPEAEEIICTDYSWSIAYCEYFNISTLDFQKELIQRNPENICKIIDLHPDLAKKYENLLNYYKSGINK